MRRMMLLLITACTMCMSFTHKDERVIIEDRPLTWDDYQGAPASSGLSVALTHSRIELDSVTIASDGTIPKFHATCYFMPGRSWVDKKFLSTCNADESAHVLQHEQTHYNIARIAAAEITREMNTFKYTPGRIAYQADSIFRTLSIRLRNVQSAYDEQTSHSRKYEQQDKWNQLIATCMTTQTLPDIPRF
ncbi:MAG: DUF922 domain-containing protein [Bacteroidetes bacterium]|nr:DUF922 domain-containing protein [Bacteroidota bacterium]